MDRREFDEIISVLKQEHHMNGWNILDMCCAELLARAGSGKAEDAAAAMLSQMMTGDQILQDPENRYSAGLKIRYYCDNLNESRGRMF